MSTTLHKAIFYGPIEAQQSVDFKDHVDVKGDLTGPTISDIYTQLGQHLGFIGTNSADLADEKKRAQDAESALSVRIDGVETALSDQGTAQTDLLNAKVMELEGKISQESGERKLADTNMINTTNNAISTLNGRCNDLVTLHNSDSKRLTDVEAALAQRDEQVDAKIEAQIAEHNTDIANLDPRVQALEQLFTIDNVNKSVTFLQGWKVVVPGEFETGLQTGAIAAYDPTPWPINSSTIDPAPGTLAAGSGTATDTQNAFPDVDPVSSS